MARITIAAVIALLALPAAAASMSYDSARHLLARTGFGGTAVEVDALTRLAYDTAVSRMLSSPGNTARTDPPAWVNEAPPDFRGLKAMGEEQRKAFLRQQRERALELKGWWYSEMITTTSPLTERMTLFWHNYFTSGLQKVKWPAFIYRQNVLLRRLALGNFRELLHAISRDPAMVLYLDNQSNRKDKPNENYARELLELFTLGEGHYTERDIKEAARAFSGWMVDRRSGEFRFNARQHDFGDKIFMGRSGTFDGDEILDILLEEPQVAIHITQKLWREFISETPDATEVARLAAVFREANYEIKPLLHALLLSPHFRAPANRGVLVKSPVELIVGTLRLLDVPVTYPERLARLGRHLGQDLLDPPNVKGWPGGTAWISSNTLLARQQFLERLSGRRAMPANSRPHATTAAMTPPMQALLPPQGLTVENAQPLLLAVPAVNPLPPASNLAARLAALLRDPAYQLK